MQTTFRFRYVLPLLLLTGSFPARGDSVLEQIQNEVTALAAQTRRAVVVIQGDKTAVGYVPNYSVSVVQTDPRREERQVLKARMEQIYNNLSTAESESERAKRLYKPTKPEYQAAKQKLGTIRRKLSQTQQELGKAGVVMYWLRQETTGTGFHIGNGYIVTTADVLEGMKNPQIVADDGSKWKVRMVGVDKRLNLGLLQVQEDIRLDALSLGDSDAVMVGNFAVSVGNQNGQKNSVALVTLGGIRDQGMTIGERSIRACCKLPEPSGRAAAAHRW